MATTVKAETPKSVVPQECAGCGKHIQDRFLLKALDLLWHEDCLKCGCCDCRLGEVGSTLYTKGNLILCKRDYLRLFGTTGYCSACNKVIPAFEMVMRAKTNVYHLECFACQQCNHRFCVGDRFFLCDNKILCEYDYEERMVFANLAYNSNSLVQLKQQPRPNEQQPGQKQELLHHLPNGCSSSSGCSSAACSGITPTGFLNNHHPLNQVDVGASGGSGLMPPHGMQNSLPMGPPTDMMSRPPCTTVPSSYSGTTTTNTNTSPSKCLPNLTSQSGPYPPMVSQMT